jgi:hypothetical protein
VATVEPAQVRLSGSVRATLGVEGDAPLRVELPEEMLDEKSSAAWRARADGPAAVTDLPDGRQRWERAYRLDPYLPGEAVHLGFAPARAFAGQDPQPKEVRWESRTVTVTTEVTGDASEARPATGIEELPPAGDAPDSLRDRVAVLTILGVMAVVAGLLVWLLRRRQGPTPTPEELAAARLAGLTANDPAFADRLSDTLRQYVEARTPVPATRLTTAEVLVGLAGVTNTLPVERLAAVLEACDAAKFAARPLTPDDRARLLTEARAVATPEAADGQP